MARTSFAEKENKKCDKNNMSPYYDWGDTNIKKKKSFPKTFFYFISTL